jgi:hypothetical protein
VSLKDISRVENGHAVPAIEILEKLARTLVFRGVTGDCTRLWRYPSAFLVPNLVRLSTSGLLELVSPMGGLIGS